MTSSYFMYVPVYFVPNYLLAGPIMCKYVITKLIFPTTKHSFYHISKSFKRLHNSVYFSFEMLMFIRIITISYDDKVKKQKVLQMLSKEANRTEITIGTVPTCCK